MQSNLLRPLAIALLAAGFGSAEGQTFNTPTYFFWGPYPQVSGGFQFSTNLTRKFAHFNLNDGYYDPGFHWYYDQPAHLAEVYADYIVAEKAAGRLEDATVAIIIQNFAYDSVSCDAKKGEPEATLGAPSARFFQSDSVDRIPGIGEWADDVGVPLFPNPRDPDAPRLSRTSGDYGEARAYRHPFIKNGLADLPNGTVRAPLRAWMQIFINRLDQIYTNNEKPGLPNPSTFRYYMDVEPIFIFEDTPNGIFMLHFLADPAHYDPNNSANYWSNPNYLIPGTSQTLQDSYNAYRTAHGYDTGADPWPANNPATGAVPWLNESAAQGAYDSHNAPILTWYHEVAQHVRDAVLDNCFHSVIREKWPNAAVKTGNYSDFSTDGAADVFGWEGDRPWLGSVASSNNDPPTFAASEQSHRWFINKARGGGYYYLAPPANVLEKRRFLDIVTKSSGTVDSPVCYSLAPSELYGVDWPVDRPGHSRVNQYSTWGTDETPWQTALRVHRHSIESAINSVPPTGSHNAAREMVPWTLMPGSDDYDNPLASDFISRGDARAMLGMFRGKNVKEGLYWTSWSPPPPEQDQSEYWTKLGAAWRDTQDSVSRVYATRVKKYTRSWAGSTMPNGSAYSDSTETATKKVERLEFTLRQAGTDREVELTSKVMPQTGPTQLYQTQLVADFDWKDATYTGPLSNGSYPSSEIHFEINIECSIAFYEQTGHVPTVSDFGLVQIWSQALNQYVSLPGDIANTSYTFVAPQSDDLRWRMRVHFEAKNISGGIFPDTGANNAPRTRIRLLQQSPLKFVTRYDLLQVWPFIPPAETSLLMGSPLSDINGDGIVDETDLTVYLDEFMAGTPAADLNLDDSIDDGDANAFIEAYVTGT